MLAEPLILLFNEIGSKGSISRELLIELGAILCSKMTPAMPIFYRSCLYEKRKYDYLLQDYPKYLTKEEFYKIAHISKATARYLLQSSKVPCKDTGKKTHRYLIPTENAIRYLEDREIHPDEYEAEPGWYSGKVKHGKKRRRSKKRKQKINASRNKLKELTDAKLEELEDLLDINDICRLTGFSSTSVLRWCRSGKLEAFMVSGKYLIPKVCLKDYIATKCGIANINKEENIMFNNLKENNQQGNMRSGQNLPTDMADEELDRRINESVIGRYGYGGMIVIVPLDRTIDDAYREVTIDIIKSGEIPLNYDTISSLHLTADEIWKLQNTPEEEKLSPEKMREINERLRKRDREQYDLQSAATFRKMSENSLYVETFGEEECPPIFFTNQTLDEQYKDLAIDKMVQGNMPVNYKSIAAFKLSPSEIRKVIKGNDLPNEVPQIPDKSTYIVPEAIAEKPASQSLVEKSANPYLDAEEDRTVSPGSLRKTVSPFDLADELMRNSVIKGFNGYIAIYLPEKGYYQIQDSVSLRNFVYQKLRPTIQAAGSVSLVDAVAKAVEYEASDYDGQVCNDYLAFQDGLLNLRTGYLEPYSPECFMTYRIEANFRQGAHTPTPYFDQMLYLMSEGDPEWQQRLKEFIGYLLAPLGERKKLILLQGVTSSGKTTLVNFINGVLSPGSVYVLDVENFSGQFSLSNLPFKAICEIQDMPNRSISASVVSKIKQLTGHDMISTDVKYESRRQFVNTAKLVFATNHAFFTKDGDAALKDRIAVIPFLRSLSNEERIPDLTERLLLERDGIIYKCLNAYLALPYSSEFTGAGKPQYEVNYAVGFDSTNIDAAVMTFLTSYFVPSPDGSVFIEDAYNLFCSKVLPVSLQDFSVRFKRYAESSMSVTHTRKRKPGQKNPQSCLEGIAFKQ